jgi:histidinol dehydrogenase
MSLLPILKQGDPALNVFLNRRPAFDAAASVLVAEIIKKVETRGEEGVLEFVRTYDAPGLTDLWVSEQELSGAQIDAEHWAAMRHAIDRIREFHETQLGVITEGWEELEFCWGWRTTAVEHEVESKPNTMELGPFKIPMPDQQGDSGPVGSGMLGQRLLPIERVGVYVPGGKASYPSSVLMNVIPAQVAGVEEVILATPPDQNGKIPEAVLVACRELGITQIMKAGGAAAVAALAVGVSGRNPVDLLVGPGSTWVTEAKRQLWGRVGLTAYAGPSEVCVCALPGCDSVAAAADLLAQLEHSDDNSGLLIAFSDAQLKEIHDSISVMLGVAPRRDLLRTALSQHSASVVVSTIEEAAQIINRYAPEHLALLGDDPADILPLIRNAGCIALGTHTPQSAGDFASGPSHTLPTSGAARFGSPLNVQDFLKYQNMSALEPRDLKHLDPIIQAFAQMEGFPAHGQASTVRLSPYA